MVEYFCQDCGGEIYWVRRLGVWYHCNQLDILCCPAEVVEPAEAAGV